MATKKDKLLEIGRDVASIWGGYCTDFEINNDEKKVYFLCEEHGEEFYTSMTFEEIKEEYGVDIHN